MNIFIDKDRTKDLNKSNDVILNYAPREKGSFEEDKILNDLESINNHPINGIVTGNKTLLSMGKVASKL